MLSGRLSLLGTRCKLAFDSLVLHWLTFVQTFDRRQEIEGQSPVRRL